MKRFARAFVATLLTSLSLNSVSMDVYERQVHDATQDWSIGGPSAWLRTLRENPRTVFYVGVAADHWIQESDLATLIAEVNSEVPAGVVCHLASAHAVHVDVQSTVGREAAILVDAFRRGARYPGSCSDLNTVDVAELQQWWRQRNR